MSSRKLRVLTITMSTGKTHAFKELALGGFDAFLKSVEDPSNDFVVIQDGEKVTRFARWGISTVHVRPSTSAD